MPKEEWGVKRVCPTTGKRFYDLGRDPIISPYTGEVVVFEVEKGGRGLVADTSTKMKAKDSEDEDDVVVIDDGLETDDTDVSIDDDSVDLEEDDVLEQDDDSTVSLDDLADVARDEDDAS